jgi:hypothetical protein
MAKVSPTGAMKIHTLSERLIWSSANAIPRAVGGYVFVEHYSTVTDFARFLGLSTSVPFCSAA